MPLGLGNGMGLGLTNVAATGGGGAPAATFSSGATDKYSTITLSGGALHADFANAGTYNGVRASRASSAGLVQFDFLVTAMGQRLLIGVEDGTTDFSVGGAQPGVSDTKGAAILLWPGVNGWFEYNNGTVTSDTGGGAAIPLVNDIYSVVFNTSTKAVSFYRTRSGTTVQLGSTTTVTFSTFKAFVCGLAASDAGTINFGATSLAATGTGAAVY